MGGSYANLMLEVSSPVPNYGLIDLNLQVMDMEEDDPGAFGSFLEAVMGR